jgi:hypothetical protein
MRKTEAIESATGSTLGTASSSRVDRGPSAALGTALDFQQQGVDEGIYYRKHVVHTMKSKIILLTRRRQTGALQNGRNSCSPPPKQGEFQTLAV